MREKMSQHLAITGKVEGHDCANDTGTEEV